MSNKPNRAQGSSKSALPIGSYEPGAAWSVPFSRLPFSRIELLALPSGARVFLNWRLGVPASADRPGDRLKAGLQTGLVAAPLGRARRWIHRDRATARGRLLLIGLSALAGLLGAQAEPNREPASPAELFQVARIWKVHLRFTPEQWDAMEPTGGRGGFFGGPGGRRGPGGFGLGMFLAPAFLKDGDQDQDGKLSKAEFQALAGKWFTAWDKEEGGELSVDEVRAGLSSTLLPPNFGPPGAGGPGRRGPGMFLQGPEGKRNGVAAAAGIEFKYVHAELEFEGRTFKDVAVRYKGNGTFMQSRGSLKRSLKVDLNKYVKGQKFAGVSKLNFHNNVTDASWMNEVMSHWLYRDAGVPAPRTAYARVFLTVPGKFDHQYLGLYSLVEDVDKHFAEENFGNKKGAMFKPVTPSLFSDLGDDWKKYKQTYDPKTELSDQQIQRVLEFCRVVTHADDAEFAAKLGSYLELDEFARFMAVMVYLSDLDGILGPGQNLYVYLHPKTDRFTFIPWDQDHSFGQMRGSQEERERLSIHKPWMGENRFLERVFKVDAFKKLYLAKLAQFNQTIFKPERFDRQVDHLAAAIRPAVREESEEKLARFDRVVAGESVAPAPFGGGFGGPRPAAPDKAGPQPGRGGTDGPRFGGFGGFFEPAKPIKGFVKARAESLLDQVAGKSEGETIGDFGFGRGGGRGGPGGPGRRGGFGPGMFLGNAFMTALDANKDGKLTRDELTRGFAKWFAAWNTDSSGLLTEEQIRAGINNDLSPFRGGPPGGPGFGPQGGPPPGER